jgi:hypothetical protein
MDEVLFISLFLAFFVAIYSLTSHFLLGLGNGLEEQPTGFGVPSKKLIFVSIWTRV